MTMPGIAIDLLRACCASRAAVRRAMSRYASASGESGAAATVGVPESAC